MQKKKFTESGNPLAEEFKKVDAEIREIKFWNYVCFADTINRYCEITMKKDDISPLHSIAMIYLVRAGGTSTPTQLAEKMFRSKHSVTKIVDNLEKEGFIKRDFSSKDRRVTQIRVTRAGLEYVKKNQNKGTKRAYEVMDCLTETERQTMADLASKMNSRMTGILEKL